jgi:hypothetical protein
LTDAFFRTYYVYTNFTGFEKNPPTQIPQSFGVFLYIFIPGSLIVNQLERQIEKAGGRVTTENSRRKKEKREAGVRD